MIDLLEWAGCLTGLCGAGLLALNNRYSGWGFVLFLISNIAWIFFGVLTHATGMVVMQIGFTVTSMIGVWTWLIVGGGSSRELSRTVLDVQQGKLAWNSTDLQEKRRGR